MLVTIITFNLLINDRYVEQKNENTSESEFSIIEDILHTRLNILSAG